MNETFPALQVPVLRTPDLRQLWQCPGQVKPCTSRIQVEGLFSLYPQLARRLKAGVEEPQLRPRGAWEFSLADGEGNHLVFVQWATTGAFTRGEHQQRAA